MPEVKITIVCCPYWHDPRLTEELVARPFSEGAERPVLPAEL
jgi:hypothetical protein